MQRHSRQLAETLANIEVAQRTDFEERHVVLGRVRFGVSLLHLPLEREMQPVPDEDLWDARRVLWEGKR